MIELVGNFNIKQHLAKRRLKGALLFKGPKVGKASFAKHFATKALEQDKASTLFSHPDLHLYKPTGKAAFHTMESMKSLLKEIYLPPSIAKQKIFIIEHADRMPIQSMNLLLKTLEEPPKKVTIILTSHESLISTIESRCQKIYFCPIAQEEIEKYLIENENVELEEAKRISRISFGSLTRALILKENLLLFENFTNLLSNIDGLNFSSMKQGVQFIDNAIEVEKKNLERKLQERLKEQDFSENVHEMQTKQIEGEVTLFGLELIEMLFDWTMRHFRDGYVVERLRFFPSMKAPIKPLLLVDTILAKAKRMMDYQMRFSNILEKLFLDLQTL